VATRKTELVGSDHRIINSGYHPKGFWKNAWEAMKKGKVWRNEVLNKGKKGNLYWVDTFIYPFQDEEGTIVGYFSIRNDITERKNIEIECDERMNC
jgi:PAS domain S-box-containing protein